MVVRSPLIAIVEYEKERGMPKNWIDTLTCVLAPYSPHIPLHFPIFSTFFFFQFMGNHSTRTGSQGAWQRFERGEADLSIPFLSAVWLRPVQYRAGKGLVCRILQEAGVACVSFRYQAVHPSVSRIRNLPYSTSRVPCNREVECRWV